MNNYIVLFRTNNGAVYIDSVEEESPEDAVVTVTNDWWANPGDKERELIVIAEEDADVYDASRLQEEIQ